jgi:hypothetical protein
MKRITRVAAAALLLAVTACDRIPLLGKKAAPPADTAQVSGAAMDTTPAVPAPAPEPAPPVAAEPLADEPWTPIDTGTVNPGMTREDVIALWGVPVAERTVGARAFLYFRNGCEVSCGTFDVVMLENNQVVDAIVRGPGHTYSGVSSSPPGKPAAPTLPAVPDPARPGG